MNNVSNITKGGIFAALSFIFIYFCSILPTSRLSMLTITSFIVILSIINTGIKNSVILYMAVSLLSFFIAPSKLVVCSYILFFGLYGFVKYYIESLKKIPIEIILKLVFFNIIFFILIFLYKIFFIGDIDLSQLKFPFYIIIGASEILFILFDYILTLFIGYYNRNWASKF